MYRIIILLLSTFILSPGFLSSQKKSMAPDVYNEWNRIQDRQISKNGDWILYSLTTEVGDETLKIYHTRDKKTITFHRSSNPQFDASGNYVIFNTTAPYDTIRKLKLAKTKKNDLPGDTLTIFDTNNNTLTKIENVKNHKLSSKWGQHLIVHLEVVKNKKRHA